MRTHRPSPLRVWWLGARPRTLGAGIVPVVVGTAAADAVSAWRATAALAVALGLQVGVNYANDYADGVRGVDTAERRGPVRLVASGLATPRTVAAAAAIAFAVAAAAGTVLALATDLRLLVLGGVAIAAAVLYSGGQRPYAGLGLGELAVFVFFGPVAVCGTAYVHAQTVPVRAWWAAVPVGLLAVAILVANNLRDIPTDAAAGKRTLAVRIGENSTRRLFRATLALALASVPVGMAAGALPPASLMALVAAPLAVRPWRLAGRARGAELVGALTGTAALHAAAGLLLAAGMWLA